jgi:hypothetical protein
MKVINPNIASGQNPKRWLDGHHVDETEVVKAKVIGDS